MEMPLISIIVPVYKVEPYLRQCVDSILQQTYTNLEIILVDDGSPDGCPAICEDYAKKDGRVRVIHKENGGVSSARNAGLRAATGDYIGFADSDDWLDPEYFEKLASIAIEEQCDVVIGGMRNDGAGDGSELLPDENIVLNPTEFAQQFWPLFHRGLLSGPYTRLWRRGCVQQLFDVRMTCGEDVRFNMQNQKHARRIGLVRTAGYHYRIPFVKRGTVKYGKKPEYKGSLYSESVAEYLSSVLPEEQWREQWEAFYCGNICRDTQKITLTNSVPDAIKELKEKLSNEDVRTILQHRAWKTLSLKYRVVGTLLSKGLVLPVVIAEKIIG